MKDAKRVSPTTIGTFADLNIVLSSVTVDIDLLDNLITSPFSLAHRGQWYRWQSVFGGTFSDYAVKGVDPGGFSGLHARMAMGGADSGSSIGADMVVAIPQPLAVDIIASRGWYFPLPPGILERVRARRKAVRRV